MNSVLSGSCRVSSIALSAIVLLGAASGSATADDLRAVGGIEARPYPYRLLGLRPGDPVDDLAELFAERSYGKMKAYRSCKKLVFIML